MAEVDQVLGGDLRPGGVVDRHRRRPGVPPVDEHQRHAQVLQALALRRRQLQRPDDQRVGVAAGGQGREEVVPLIAAEGAVDQQLLPAVVQGGIGRVEQAAVEPGRASR